MRQSITFNNSGMVGMGKWQSEGQEMYAVNEIV
jgi:hypothetical protein